MAAAITDLVLVKGAYDQAGGPETVLQMIAAHLDRQRFPPLLTLLVRPGYELPQVLAGVAATMPSRRLAWHGLATVPRAALALARILREKPGAILHTNDMRADLLGFLVTRFVRVPWIAHVHGWLGETHRGRWKLYENIDRWLIRHADLVLVGSHAMANECRKAGARRVEIVTNGIPAADPAPHAAEAARIRAATAPEGAVLVGLLGRLHPGKGHPLLIRAIAALREKGLDIRALFIGEGPAEADYRAEAARLRVTDYIRFAGLVPDPLPYLLATDIVCVPSLKDSLPLTAFEAMSMERPVVASRAGDLPLAIKDGVTGILVDVGSAEALAAALERLANDADLRRRLGVAGQKNLIENFSPDAMLRQLQHYCEQLLVGRRFQ